MAVTSRGRRRPGEGVHHRICTAGRLFRPERSGGQVEDSRLFGHRDSPCGHDVGRAGMIIRASFGEGASGQRNRDRPGAAGQARGPISDLNGSNGSVRSATTSRRGPRPHPGGRVAGDRPPAVVGQPLERVERGGDHPAGVLERDALQRAGHRRAGDIGRDVGRRTGRPRPGRRVLRAGIGGPQDERDVAGVRRGRGLHERPRRRPVRPRRRLDEPERVRPEQRAPDRDLGDRAGAGGGLLDQPRRAGRRR